MANDYGSMQTRIADEISRSDLTSQIQLAILAAIKWYEREPWYFNQTSTTVPTVASTQAYNLPSDYKQMDAMTVTISTVNIYRVTPRPWTLIRDKTSQTSLIGQPMEYGIYGQQFWLYPIPDAVYTITEYYWNQFTVLTNNTDTNAWMVDGEELIRYRAKADLFTNVIRDFDEAGAMTAAAKGAYDNLCETSSRRMAPAGRITPTFL